MTHAKNCYRRLTFNEFGEVVVGYADIANYITLFLSQSGVQSAVTTPNNSIIIIVTLLYKRTFTNINDLFVFLNVTLFLF